MGETVDIICNVKSYGKWKFKKGNLPSNTTQKLTITFLIMT